MTREYARKFINSLVELRNAATDPQAAAAQEVYPAWKVEVNYTAGDRVLYNDILYKVLQNHISQETWAPDVAVSLFAKVLIPDVDTVYEWEQSDSTNPYMNGDKVTYNGKTWISTVDNNVWEPGSYGWKEI